MSQVKRRAVDPGFPKEQLSQAYPEAYPGNTQDCPGHLFFFAPGMFLGSPRVNINTRVHMQAHQTRLFFILYLRKGCLRKVGVNIFIGFIGSCWNEEWQTFSKKSPRRVMVHFLNELTAG